MATININSPTADENVRYVKGKDGMVRKMYLIQEKDGVAALQKTAIFKPNSPIYYYLVDTVYTDEKTAQSGVCGVQMV